MRKPCYQITTYFDQTKKLYYKEGTKESTQHLNEIKEIHTYLDALFDGNKNISVVTTLPISENILAFPLVSGENIYTQIATGVISWKEALDHAKYVIQSLPSCSQSGTKKIGKHNKTGIKKFHNMFGWGSLYVQFNKDLVPGILDITLSNIFRNSETRTYSLIDQERYCNDPLPREYLLFRAVHVLYQRIKHTSQHLKACPSFNYIDMCTYIGIRKRKIPLYRYRENHFQHERVNTTDTSISLLFYLMQVYRVYGNNIT